MVDYKGLITVPKSTRFNARHGIWNIDRSQSTAVPKSTRSNASYGTWNIDGGQIGRAHV